VFWVGVVAAPATGYHVAITAVWPDGLRLRFAGVLAAVIAGLLWVIYRRCRARLPSLWALGRLSRPPTPSEVKRALMELGAFPEWVLRATFERWFVGMLLIAAAMGWWRSDPHLLLRLLLAGLGVAPLTALLARFLSARACRTCIRRLANLGLPFEDVLAAVPPSRYRLRQQLVWFVALSLSVPMLLTIDAAFALARDDIQQIVAEPSAPDRQALAASLSARRDPRGYALFALSAVISLYTAFFVGTSLRDPLRRIALQAGGLSRAAEAPPEVIPAEDEVWVVSAAFTRMQAQLREILGRLRRAGGRLASAGDQLLSTFAGQRVGASEQASALTQTFATTEELARSAGQIAVNGQEVAGMAQRTLSAAVAGQKSSEQFYASMLRMKLDTQAVADSVVKLNKRMQQIGKIVEFINGVADKLDLLALNAELEGTKAGSVGRGFSLVAAEMRRLAENVMRSTQEISRLIQEIRDATNAAVMATEAGLKATDHGTRMADQVLGSLGQILGLASQTSDAVRAISLATQQQQTGTNQLAEAMGDILRVTEESAEATRQMNASTEDLAALAGELRAAVDRFHLGPAPAGEERRGEVSA
jgi:methyl-accepting chemotaxis protein